MSYRFQVSKKSWHVNVVDSLGREQVCILQMESSPDERVLENVTLDVDDAKVAATYAHRFNLQQRQAISGAAATEAPSSVAADNISDKASASGKAPSDTVPSDALIHDGSLPRVRVA